jgi:hypothetical protein
LHTIESAENGEFELMNILPGSYRVIVNTEGFPPFASAAFVVTEEHAYEPPLTWKQKFSLAARGTLDPASLIREFLSKRLTTNAPGPGTRRALGLGWGAPREIRSQLRGNEFLEDIRDSRFPNPDQRVREHQSDCIAILGWIVEIGDSAGGEISGDAGIVRLPVSIVALADNGVG